MSTIAIDKQGMVARITIDRPDKRNAIDDATRDALGAALVSFDAEDSVRVVVLTGRDPAFCSGVDLSGATKAAPGTKRPRIVEAFEKFEKPIVAAINGVALGGGLEIALACDVRVASTNARFALTEVMIGSLPGSGGTQRLPNMINPALAAYMLYTGEFISADRALSAGLVSELCQPDVLMARADEIAQTMSRNAPLSLRAAKRALRKAVDARLADGLKLERELFEQLATTEDRQEGRAAFRERRPPNFKGR